MIHRVVNIPQTKTFINQINYIKLVHLLVGHFYLQSILVITVNH